MARHTYWYDIAGRVWLYRLFDSTGKLLYVGVTNNPDARFRTHRRQKAWWPEVASHTLTEYEYRAHAFRCEKEAIRDENPAYNIVRAMV